MENTYLTYLLSKDFCFFFFFGIYEKQHHINEICCLVSTAYSLQLTVTHCCLLLAVVVVVVKVAQGQCSVA